MFTIASKSKYLDNGELAHHSLAFFICSSVTLFVSTPFLNMKSLKSLNGSVVFSGAVALFIESSCDTGGQFHFHLAAGCSKAASSASYSALILFFYFYQVTLF